MNSAPLCPFRLSLKRSVFSPHRHESGSLLFYSAPTHIPSLLHLSRLSLRKAVSSPSSLPLLPLPPALLPYLTYRRL